MNICDAFRASKDGRIRRGVWFKKVYLEPAPHLEPPIYKKDDDHRVFRWESHHTFTPTLAHLTADDWEPYVEAPKFCHCCGQEVKK